MPCMSGESGRCFLLGGLETHNMPLRVQETRLSLPASSPGVSVPETQA